MTPWSYSIEFLNLNIAKSSYWTQPPDGGESFLYRELLLCAINAEYNRVVCHEGKTRVTAKCATKLEFGKGTDVHKALVRLKMHEY